MHIKTVKVKNPKNVLVQVPGFVANKWGIQGEDGIEVHISDDEQSIILKPKKGYVTVRTGEPTDR